MTTPETTIRLRNISPLGYVNAHVLGRVGPAPTYAFCAQCQDPTHPKYGSDPDHEHNEIVDENGAGDPGQGCLIPGEEFDVPKKLGEELLKQTDNFERVEPKKQK